MGHTTYPVHGFLPTACLVKVLEHNGIPVSSAQKNRILEVLSRFIPAGGARAVTITSESSESSRRNW